MNKINIFTANATKELALKVVQTINENNTGMDEPMSGEQRDLIELGDCTIEYFKNKEITCQYQNSIRDKKIYIFGSTGTHDIMELLLMIDAAKRASVGHVTVVIPCYGYARQDKKEGIRGPLAARLVANMLETAGAQAIISLDIHSESIQGFFNIPFNHINGYSIFKSTLREIIKDNPDKHVICSPDGGGLTRASRIAKKMNLDVVAINKERDKPGSISRMILAADVNGMMIDLADDMADSAKTLCMAADYLINDKGAISVNAICTHPVFSEGAIERIEKTKNLSHVYVSDTLPLSEEAKNCSKITVISSANILAKIISRVNDGKSMDEANK